MNGQEKQPRQLATWSEEAQSTTRGPLAGELLRLRAGEPVRRLPGRNWTKADVLVFRSAGGDVAVKDYGPRSFLVRNTLGRFLTARETRAYRIAAGLPGLPPFLGRLGPHAIAMRWVAGEPLSALGGRRLEGRFFDELAAVVSGLHSRGIAHGDLHHRDVLARPDGSPLVLDLATSWLLGPCPGRLRRALFERLEDADRHAVARMRARFAGTGSAAAGIAPRTLKWHARGRRLKSWWDRVRGRRRG